MATRAAVSSFQRLHRDRRRSRAHLSRVRRLRPRARLGGRAAPELPRQLIPKGVEEKVFKRFALRRPEEVRPEERWAIRPAEKIDFNGLRGYFPDPHCTYLVLLTFYAPFGSRAVIEDEFPHCGFFDIQATPSFHPEAYHYNGAIGVGGVPNAISHVALSGQGCDAG